MNQLENEKCRTCEGGIKEDQAYCSSCGAKIVRRRLSVKMVLADMANTLAHLDGPFFTTVKWLVIHPEKVGVGYINGVRKKINSPLRFALITATLYGFFLFLFTDFTAQVKSVSMLNGLKEGLAEGANNERKITEVLERAAFIVDWFQNNSQYLVFFMLPFFTLLSKLFYRKKKYNLAEHVTIAFYTFSGGLLVDLVIGLIAAQFGTLEAADFYVDWGIFLIWFAMIWVLKKNLGGSWIKAALIIFLAFFITLTVITFVIVFVLGIMEGMQAN